MLPLLHYGEELDGDLPMRQRRILLLIRQNTGRHDLGYIRLKFPTGIDSTDSLTFWHSQSEWWLLLNQFDLSTLRQLWVAVPGSSGLFARPSGTFPGLPAGGVTNAPPVIEFPALTRLELRGFDAVDTDVFCRRMAVPMLRALHHAGISAAWRNDTETHPESKKAFPRPLSEPLIPLDPIPFYMALTHVTITVYAGSYPSDALGSGTVTILPRENPLTLFPNTEELVLSLPVYGAFGSVHAEVMKSLGDPCVVMPRLRRLRVILYPWKVANRYEPGYVQEVATEAKRVLLEAVMHKWDQMNGVIGSNEGVDESGLAEVSLEWVVGRKYKEVVWVWRAPKAECGE